MHVLKSGGARTDPCLTPVFTGKKLDSQHSHFWNTGLLIGQKSLQKSHSDAKDARVFLDALNETLS